MRRRDGEDLYIADTNVQYTGEEATRRYESGLTESCTWYGWKTNDLLDKNAV